MQHILPLTVMACLPPSVTLSRYRFRMESDSKKTVRENVTALLSHRRPLRAGESGVTRLKSLGVSHGNAQRAVDAESDMRLATLDEIASGLKVKSWQLLVAGLDPAALPSVEPPDRRLSDAALRVAAIYDRAPPSDRKHIDAIADATTRATDHAELPAPDDAASNIHKLPKTDTNRRGGLTRNRAQDDRRKIDLAVELERRGSAQTTKNSETT